MSIACLVIVAVGLLKLISRLLAKSPLDKLRGPARTSILRGHLDELNSIDGWDFHQRFNEEYPGIAQIWGPFASRYVYVSDPLAMYHIMVKVLSSSSALSYFCASADNEHRLSALVFGRGLLSTFGHDHKRQRKLMNPVFSMAHMKYMVPQFYDVCHQLCDVLTTQVAEGEREIDILVWMTRTAMELIGRAGLGYSFDPLTENSDNHYASAIKALVPVLAESGRLRELVPYFTAFNVPSVFKSLLPYVPIKRVQRLRDVAEALDKASHEVYEAKKAALQRGDEAVMQQVGRGKDIMSILLKANLEANEEDQLPESDVIAQMSTLVFAATDTTTNALSRILYLLSENPDVQHKLRDEILEARNSQGHELMYDELDALPYMDAVIRETLRLYPPVPILFRTATKDMILPLLKPVTGADGSQIRECAIPRGTTVVVSLRNINLSKDYWGDDALTWNPERFLKPLPAELLEAHVPGIYSNMMTFSGGGFSCIGFKFSLLEMKVVLALLLERFTFSLPKAEIKWNMGGIVVRSHARVKGLSRCLRGYALVPVRCWNQGCSYASTHVAIEAQ
ncbi:cytochrome P450 [Punctularia strigosozonata HHB-11173 SS5]|uniref:cytochrome P450 n=1 Tax=Punctularia strigosozonata (strain HHB-11173) TaxID=741275 RepID=UPI000441774B|nr:cytochrome P450 [Punctularia strigosozonata HHB-11173 SS5]EIN05371.1 cytochrome P450 [Punctularia strigosozonata HHB-11173 SS5]